MEYTPRRKLTCTTQQKSGWMRIVVRNNELDEARAAALLEEYGVGGAYAHATSVYGEVPDAQVAKLAGAFNAKLRPQLGSRSSLGLCVVQSLPQGGGKKLAGGLQQDAAFKAFAAGEPFSLQLQTVKKVKASGPKPKKPKARAREGKEAKEAKDKEAKPKAQPKEPKEPKEISSQPSANAKPSANGKPKPKPRKKKTPKPQT